MTGAAMLWNPTNHKRKQGMAKRRTRKHLTKKQQRYFGTRAQRAALRRKVGRKSRRKGRVRATVTEKIVYRKNPRGNMAKKRRGGHHRKRRYARRVHRRRFRRNPVSSGMFGETFGCALIGAGGAIATDFLAGILPTQTLTQSLGSFGQPLINIGLSLLVGVAVDAIAGPKAGGDAAAGGIIVALYNLANQSLLPMLSGQQGQGTQGQFSQFNQGFGTQGGQGFQGQFQNQGQLNRYLRGRLGFINRQRFLRGLPPLASPASRQFARLQLNPAAVRPAALAGRSPWSAMPRRHNRGALRGADVLGRLGYTGPAPTLGRYLTRGA